MGTWNLRQTLAQGVHSQEHHGKREPLILKHLHCFLLLHAPLASLGQLSVGPFSCPVKDAESVLDSVTTVG